MVSLNLILVASFCPSQNQQTYLVALFPEKKYSFQGIELPSGFYISKIPFLEEIIPDINLKWDFKEEFV